VFHQKAERAASEHHPPLWANRLDCAELPLTCTSATSDVLPNPNRCRWPHRVGDHSTPLSRARSSRARPTIYGLTRFLIYESNHNRRRRYD